MRKLTGILVAIIAVGFAAYSLWPKPGDGLRAEIVSAAKSLDASGFAKADALRTLTFPLDHGAHNDFQTEWWYYTGNLTATTGQRFGYQLTFFRRALVPPAERTMRASSWAADQVYMAHFAITDAAASQHYSFEKLARGSAGIAGAQADPFRVWLEGWSVAAEADGTETPDRAAPAMLRAAAGDVSVELRLSDQKGPVLHGDRGYSLKGPERGNASYYYSLTRSDSVGTISVRGTSYQVQGSSWMDHEFSTSALGRDQVGWDWFSLQLDDNTELMAFQLRRTDGSLDPFSSGTLIAADGSTRHLSPGDFALRGTGTWRSPRTGGEYPSGWELEASNDDIRLTITPLIADQEMSTSYDYWEGAVTVQGTAYGHPVTGAGYVELTGYAQSMQGEF